MKIAPRYLRRKAGQAEDVAKQLIRSSQYQHCFMRHTRSSTERSNPGFKPVKGPQRCPEWIEAVDRADAGKITLLIRGLEGWCTQIQELASWFEVGGADPKRDRSRIQVIFYSGRLDSYSRVFQLSDILDPNCIDPLIRYIQSRWKSLCNTRATSAHGANMTQDRNHPSYLGDPLPAGLVSVLDAQNNRDRTAVALVTARLQTTTAPSTRVTRSQAARTAPAAVTETPVTSAATTPAIAARAAVTASTTRPFGNNVRMTRTVDTPKGRMFRCQNAAVVKPPVPRCPFKNTSTWTM